MSISANDTDSSSAVGLDFLLTQQQGQQACNYPRATCRVCTAWWCFCGLSWYLVLHHVDNKYAGGYMAYIMTYVSKSRLDAKDQDMTSIIKIRLSNLSYRYDKDFYTWQYVLCQNQYPHIFHKQLPSGCSVQACRNRPDAMIICGCFIITNTVNPLEYRHTLDS